jgi:hypothetical protein
MISKPKDIQKILTASALTKSSVLILRAIKQVFVSLDFSTYSFNISLVISLENRNPIKPNGRLPCPRREVLRADGSQLMQADQLHASLYSQTTLLFCK